MLTGPDNPVGDAVTFPTLNAYFTSIGGGTDQIQRNIVGDYFIPDNEVVLKELPIYNILKDNYYYGTNYIFINTYFSPDRLDAEYLLDYVSNGNNVFISAFGIYGDLADSLRIKTFDEFFSQDSVSINFSLPEVKTEKGYSYFRGNFENYFSEFDTTLVQVLGKNENGNVNYLRIKYGKGNFFLNTVPLAFTNYHLLNSDNNEYIYKALSHLPVQKTFWDDYYKDGNKYTASTLQYIMSQQSLKWAYFIILVSVVLFIFFYGRRKQRIIPVIPPLTNTTVEFVEQSATFIISRRIIRILRRRKYLFSWTISGINILLKRAALMKRLFKKSQINPLYQQEK